MPFNIQTEIDNLIQRSGGFIDRPADQGGPINMGITQKMLTNWLARATGLSDVILLSKQTARDIHYTQHYIKPGIDDLPELIRPIMLDMVADSGKRGIKILQDALICHGYDCGKPDGKIGPQTAGAAKAAAEQMGNELIKILVRRRVIYYEGLVKQDETLRQNLPAWIARAESFMPAQEAL